MVNISVTVSLPKVKFATKKWVEEIARSQRQHSVPALRSLFQQTVKGWSQKPSFGWSQIRTSDEMIISMYPTGPGADTWNLLDSGSPPHYIKPKRVGGKLKFQPGYRASTSPGSLISKRKYRSGKVIYEDGVNHPGFKARNFTETIADEYYKKFSADMQEAINTIART